LNAKIKLLMGFWCLGRRVGAAKKAFGGFKGWQTAGLNGFGALACRVGAAKKASGGFEAWFERQEKAIDGVLVPRRAGLGLPKGLRAGTRQV
jgi:hypothetical protein